MKSAWFNRILLAANFALFGFFVYWIAVRGVEPASQGWNPVDLITIVLTATTVVLAAVALAIALLAIWGYKAIAERAESIAKKEAELVTLQKINEYLDNAKIGEQLREEINHRVVKEADQLSTAYQEHLTTGQPISPFQNYPAAQNGEETKDAG